uniref:Uncharacterized protein n=1 Tax=Panagrolaimus sp. JU765 TaxID=591449 RepID=A0AC34RG53_9BILA
MLGATAFWMSAEIQAVIDLCSNQNIPPIATCAALSCAAGSYNYYTGATNSNPMIPQVIGSVLGECCNSLCFCLGTGECFTATPGSAGSFRVRLIPFCSTPTTCEMRGWLFSGTVVGDRGTIYTSNIFVSFLMPDPITSISCVGCPAAFAC